MSDLWIGVDGGGTRCTLWGVNGSGHVVATGEGGSLNFNNIGMDKARENLRIAVNALLRKAGERDCAMLCVGLAALDEEAGEEIKRAFAGDCFDVKRLYLTSDADAALAGLRAGKPAAMVICGTGSMIAARDGDGNRYARGGWGRMLGDEGSGYALAVSALRVAIRHWEGDGEDTALCKKALRFFGVKAPRELIPVLYAPDMQPQQIARFGAEVALCARKDPIAREIVLSEMRALSRPLIRLMQEHPEINRIGLYGGVFEHNAWIRKLFAQEIRQVVPRARVISPALPPQAGALLCGGYQGKIDAKEG